MKKYFFTLIALFMLSAGVAKAQVTIGATTDPHDFSLLELVSEGERGLRLPQMSFCEQNELTTNLKALATQAEKDAAKGLQIFNIDTKCVETWNGSKWIQTCPPEGPRPKEEILFKIRTTTDDEIYYIPTSGFVCSTYSHAYDWNVFVDGVADNTNIPNPKTRTASTNHNGIAITIPEAGTHQIRITPHSCPFTAGWGNAFGYKNDNTGNANTAANKQKLISIDAPLTTMAFAPKESESTTSASWMFANMFSGCTNLTTPAKIADTYKLPKKITDLSYFLHSTHAYNTELKAPIDLSGLEGWLDGNENITRMNGFLGSTHYNNTELKAPIDLTPLAGWFKENESIMNLAQFLAYTHIDNIALEAPIDLSPLEDWFDGNESITDLSSFLYGTHRTNTNPNTNLEAPIDLSQLKDWFDCNESITNIGSFLYHTHYNNTKLKAAINLTHLSGWFDTAGRSITTNGFLYHTHYNNISLNLTGQKIFPNWIKTLKQGTAETPIKDVTSAFERMFSCEQEKSDDTAEPEFEDGTVLSSLGVPSNPSNKRTYTNRNISPVNDGWK